MIPVVYSEKYIVDIGPHVFPVIKYRMIKEKLMQIFPELNFVEPIMPEDLELVHSKEYLEDLKELRRTERTYFSELPLTEEIVHSYILGAGGTYLASKIALKHKIGIHIGGGFHHAFSDRAEGFCYINDIAYAIKKLQKEKKIKRACVIDCDLHQGNGTAKIFENCPSVWTFSIHEENNYPVKQKSNLDIGLESGIKDTEYLNYLEKALSTIEKEKPFDLIIYQAGADPYEKDILGGLLLTKQGLKKRDEIVRDFSMNNNIPVCVTLGGGYASDTEDTVEIHLNTILTFLEKTI